MSYFPCDIPYMSDEELKENGIKIPKDVHDTNVGNIKYINKQVAIDVLAEQIALCDKALKSFGISMKDEYAVKVERASLIAYKEQLEAIPAADVVPVVHSRWKYKCGEIHCPECGNKIHRIDLSGYLNFCPNCGAKMDGKGEE